MSASLTQQRTNRILGLDIVRSVAIFLVVWTHSTYVFSTETAHALNAVFPDDVGVPIFFVLSGYLIGGILLRDMNDRNFSMIDMGKFWLRRWLRTLPNYFFVLIFLVLYDITVYEADWDYWWSYFFFLQNLISPNPVFFPEAWSLSVEEWFYLSFPLCCLAGLKLGLDKKKVVLCLAGFFIVVPTVLRLYAYGAGFYPDIGLVRFIVIYRLDGLMYGVLGAYAHRYAPEFWNSVRTLGVRLAMGSLVVLSITRFFLSTLALPAYFYTVASIMTLAALPYFSTLRSIGSESWTRIFRFVSVISYSMYLLNLSVIQWRVVPAFLSITGLGRVVGPVAAAILAFVLFWPMLIGGSYLLYRYFETPWMNLRDRMIKNRSVVCL
jgi:peptidoglycan/LPS O-acetylase OafA/YrhL